MAGLQEAGGGGRFTGIAAGGPMAGLAGGFGGWSVSVVAAWRRIETERRIKHSGNAHSLLPLSARLRIWSRWPRRSRVGLFFPPSSEKLDTPVTNRSQSHFLCFCLRSGLRIVLPVSRYLSRP